MEVLVRLEYIDNPEEVVAAERAMAADLRRDGKLVRMWRDPCQKANWTLWNVADADELHRIFAALPMFPYFGKREVHILAEHPVDPKTPHAI
ncbi:muconolactone Delta-isomerase [Halomonas elongata]|uniref:muconolactone Delta-isomerase n=1 Tax=Halomonas elongata TaxID=2746 RepID=UPI0038D36A9E